MEAGFGKRLLDAVERTNSVACIGLDPHLHRLPRSLFTAEVPKEQLISAAAEAVLRFNTMVIEAVADHVPAVKPQLAFYEQLGSAGWAVLEETCKMARQAGLLVIGDGKRGDIASTAGAYARALLDDGGPLGCDAMTVNPWMGIDTIDPYLDLLRTQGKGLFVLLRTTNPGSRDLQCWGEPRAFRHLAGRLGEVAARVDGDAAWSSVGVVVGASAAADAAQIRAVLPRAWFLVPGYGAQGGSAQQALAGNGSNKRGCLVSSSRAVLYPPSPDADYDADPRPYITSRVLAMNKNLLAK